MNNEKLNQSANPLLADFDFPPFDLINAHHYEPAIKTLLEEAKVNLAEIINSQEAPTFPNTIEALENLSGQLDKVSSILFNLHSAETSEDLEKAVEMASPLLASFSNDILLDDGLFARVDAVWNNREELALNAQQSKLLEKTYKSFKRNGASLNKEDKERLRAIDEELSLESIQFGQVILQDTNNYYLNLPEEYLKGLPEGALEAAKSEASNRNLEGGVITLQYPSYVPAMTYLENREIRQKLHLAFGSRGLKNEKNNKQRVFKIAQLRKERATLLGYESHAEFILEERMAKSPDNVFQFLQQLKDKAKPAAEAELNELKALAAQDGIQDFNKWDVAYYSEKSKQAKFQLESEKLKAYFPLDAVLDGAFQVANNLYDISFQKVDDVPIYHQDVDVYKVVDSDGRLLSWFYTDFFPRKGKRAGAWMTSFRDQKIVDNQEIRPQISIVCNFTPPSESRPSLLSFQEVTTLFHEFGHALHGMLAEGVYSSLNGTHVHWDFVELPSQVMENWCFEEECLKLFARHYETNELIPAQEVQKIRDASNHMEGLQTLRQLGFGLLDMTWHHNLPEVEDLEQLENGAMNDIDLIGPLNGTATSTAFSHIFQGGYSAGYYSYKWAEVLDADAFELFQEKGIFNKKTATAFKKLLSSGGQIEPSELYREFRGKDATPDALLRRAGLLK